MTWVRAGWVMAACLLAAGACVAQIATVVYPRPESATDSQYLYDYELLRQALEATIPTHGLFELRPSAKPMNQARAGDEIAAGGEVNVFARSTAIEHEQRFWPVRIPLDKGLVSFRVFLIRGDMQPKFAAVESLEQLRAFSVGSFFSWADTQILRAAGFKVVTGDSYEGLFRSLAAGRFDFFSRSADEAYREFDERRLLLPALKVENSVLLHFPTTRYFFVQRGDAGRKLAERIEAGLETMIQTGAFEAHFVRFKGALIVRAQLHKRKVFRIDNPYMSPETHALRKARPGLAGDEPPGLALVHQVAHGLLAHAGALGQLGEARALQRQVARDVDVRRRDLATRGQVGQRQRYVDLVGHQVQHARVEAACGMAEQPAQVSDAPAVVRVHF